MAGVAGCPVEYTVPVYIPLYHVYSTVYHGSPKQCHDVTLCRSETTPRNSISIRCPGKPPAHYW
eukprot:5734998-Pyramimonas_sp.AAC.3